jgi:hypothetical protein
MPVQALLERHARQQVVDVQHLLLLDHPVQGQGPGPQPKALGRLPDLLVRAELVKIVVGRDQTLVGKPPVEIVALVARGRVTRP